jgi:hypothetical protein
MKRVPEERVMASVIVRELRSPPRLALTIFAPFRAA